MASKPPFILIPFLLFIISTFVSTTTTTPPVLPNISPVKAPSPKPSSPASTSTTPPVLPHISPVTAPSPKTAPRAKDIPAAPTTPTIPSKPAPSGSGSAKSTLDPKQITALQSLNIPTTKDPCIQPSYRNATLCDTAQPFRHLVSLHLTNCTSDLELSATALQSLATLEDLAFSNCPIGIVHFPTALTSNIRTFSCVKSLKKLTGVWLGRFRNVTELTVTDVVVKASGPFVVLGNLKKVTKVTIARTNLTGYLPRTWNANISHIDLSGNLIKGRVHTGLTMLGNLEYLNLSNNALSEELPATFGDLVSLKNVSLAGNKMSGALPDTIGDIKGLVHLDLSGNQFNGSIPKSITGMKSLKYLNIENNNFQGVMPFNGSFIKGLVMFKIGGNDNLCYNHSKISGKVKLGIAVCDKHGLPITAAPAKESGYDDGGSDEDDTEDDDSASHKDGGRKGPSKVVLGVAIGLSLIVFLIVFLVLLSKCCCK